MKLYRIHLINGQRIVKELYFKAFDDKQAENKAYIWIDFNFKMKQHLKDTLQVELKKVG